MLPVITFVTLPFRVEADECGSLNEWLAVAPQSAPLCGTVAALVSVTILRTGRLERSMTGRRSRLKSFVRWFDTPHLPHAWECGFLLEERTKTLMCGDLFTQAGADLPAITESDILGPSEAFRHGMDYFSHTKNARAMLEKFASIARDAGVHARQRVAR